MKCPFCPPQPVFHPNNFLCYFFKKGYSIKLLALSHHVEFCFQGQAVQNNKKRGQGVRGRAGAWVPTGREEPEEPLSLGLLSWGTGRDSFLQEGLPCLAWGSEGLMEGHPCSSRDVGTG